MGKNSIKLNESQLRKVVSESVKKVLKETAIRGIDDNGKPTHYATQDDEKEDYAMEQCARAALEFIQHKESQFSQEWFNEFCDKCSHDGLFAFMDKSQMKECWIKGNKAAHSCVFKGNGVQVGRIPTHYEGGWQ